LTPFDFARAFAGAGYAVFPCRHSADPTQDKRPLIEGWRGSATTDPNQLDLWAASFPGCRWGIECEKSGLFIVDLDKKGDEDGAATLALLQADHGALPPTYTVRTQSGGTHLYFRGSGKTTSRAIGAGVDTRSVGGYAIIPDGVAYVPTVNAPIAPAPPWVVEMAGKGRARDRPEDAERPVDGVRVDRSEHVFDAIAYARQEAPGAPHGQRDVTTYKVACRVRDFGLSEPVATRIMLDYWATREDVELSEDFDQRAVEWKVRQAYKSATNRLGENLPEAAFSAIPARGIVAFDAGDLEPSAIPKREWILGTWFISRFLTVTVAPGGTGKSNLSIIEALAVITGRKISGDHVHKAGRVWLHNGEDPLDEIARRISAACLIHNVTPEEIRGKFFYTSGRTSPLLLVREQGRTVTRDASAIEAVKEFIVKNNIKLWIIDPFVDLHDVNENDNAAINMVAKTLSMIADETGCAVHVVHHTRKKGKDGAITDMDMGRGASALMSAARIGRNLNGMCDKDAEKFNLPMSPAWYVRLDSSKANLAGPSDRTRWFEKLSVDLPNGDGVGVLAPVDLERVADPFGEVRAVILAKVDFSQGRTESISALAKEIAEEAGLTPRGASKKIESVFKYDFVTDSGDVYGITWGEIRGKRAKFISYKGGLNSGF